MNINPLGVVLGMGQVPICWCMRLRTRSGIKLSIYSQGNSLFLSQELPHEWPDGWMDGLLGGWWVLVGLDRTMSLYLYGSMEHKKGKKERMDKGAFRLGWASEDWSAKQCLIHLKARQPAIQSATTPKREPKTTGFPSFHLPLTREYPVSQKAMLTK